MATKNEFSFTFTISYVISYILIIGGLIFIYGLFNGFWDGAFIDVTLNVMSGVILCAIGIIEHALTSISYILLHKLDEINSKIENKE